MKTTILTHFVAIALAVTSAMANVIPSSMNSSNAISLPSFRRASIEQVEGTINGAVPADTVLGSVPTPRNIADGPKRGLFERLAGFIPSSITSRGDNNNNNNDMQYLNLALLLSQLEFAFFDNGLNRFSVDDFRAAGYPDWVRGRYEQIREHERSHVEFLQSAVTTAGRDRVQACDYRFDEENVRAFVDISEAIATIATSAYVGGLHYFDLREYVTVLASILAVEARQAAWINASVRKQNPWNTAFETPLTPNQVLTLLASFFDFDSMPNQNRGLLPTGVHPYPILSLAPRLVPGEEAEISFPYSKSNDGEHLYAAFLVGFETIFAIIAERDEHSEGSGSANRQRFFVQVPKDLAAKGTVFVSVVKGRDNINDVRFDDSSIVAGPAIAMFPFDAFGKPIGQW